MREYQGIDCPIYLKKNRPEKKDGLKKIYFLMTLKVFILFSSDKTLIK